MCEQRGLELNVLMELMVKAHTRTTVLLKLADNMNFGKYNGELVENVVRGFPDYVRYLVKECNMGGRFDQEVIDLTKKLLEEAAKSPETAIEADEGVEDLLW